MTLSFGQRGLVRCSLVQVLKSVAQGLSALVGIPKLHWYAILLLEITDLGVL